MERTDSDGSSYSSEEPTRLGTISPIETTPIFESILLFVSSIGCTLGYTALLSNLVYYTDTLGVNSFLILNFAVYSPLLPITIAQAAWDASFDRRYKSLRTFFFRGTFGFLLSFACLVLSPWASRSLYHLSMVAILMGLSSAVLHGTLKQMSSFLFSDCARSAAAVNAGLQGSGLIVLFNSLYSEFGRCGSSKGLYLFYYSIAGALLISWLSFQWLLCCRQSVVFSMRRRDSILIPSDFNEALLSSSHSIDSSANTEVESRIPQEYSFLSLWKKSWSICFALMITVGSSMSVASCFNRVLSQNPSNTGFPQVLFYTRIVADLVSRPATLITSSPSKSMLIYASIVRLGFVPVFFVYASTNLIPRNDAGALFSVFAFSFSSGYLVTLSYQLAPTLLDDIDREKNRLKLANLMNVCFSLSVILGMITSILTLS
jgi:Nucleoside transporter